jgi:hypothetical protein
VRAHQQCAPKSLNGSNTTRIRAVARSISDPTARIRVANDSNAKRRRAETKKLQKKVAENEKVASKFCSQFLELKGIITIGLAYTI